MRGPLYLRFLIHPRIKAHMPRERKEAPRLKRRAEVAIKVTGVGRLSSGRVVRAGEIPRWKIDTRENRGRVSARHERAYDISIAVPRVLAKDVLSLRSTNLVPGWIGCSASKIEVSAERACDRYSNSHAPSTRGPTHSYPPKYIIAYLSIELL